MQKGISVPKVHRKSCRDELTNEFERTPEYHKSRKHWRIPKTC